MFYTVYKITNIVNGKHYIGKHQTKNLDDGYFGSGKRLKYAIKKYGLDNFHKEILYICSTEKEMELIEKILVVPDPEISYNLCEGGKGGFGYINSVGLNIRKSQTETQKNIARLWLKNNRHRINYKTDKQIEKQKMITELARVSNTGKKRPDHSQYMKEKQKGNLNSQYGTCWLTNGQENKKIKKDELDIWLEKGYYKGRIKINAQLDQW